MLDLSHLNLDGALVSEKLDGVQGIWDGRRLTTRCGHPIHAPRWFTAGLPRRRLVGELYAGRGNFDLVRAIVRTRDAGERWKQIQFGVFDGLDALGGTWTRANARFPQALIGPCGIKLGPYAAAVAQNAGLTAGEIRMYYFGLLGAGAEGIIIRTADGTCHKFKPVSDDVARVVDTTPGRGRYRGVVGALVVEDREGRTFRLGNGLTDQERIAPPPVGSLVEYEFEGHTSSGLPRFARFRRRRAEIAFV